MQNPTSIPNPGILECALPINTGPMHWVFNAAVHWINFWVQFGTPPPIAPRLQATTAPGVSPVVYASDVHGNTLGGIRSPYVDVPIAKLTGTGNGAAPGAPPASSNCVLFGQTVPFTADQIAALYRNHGAYVRQFVAADMKAVLSTYLMFPDAELLLQAAAQSDIAK